MAAPLTDYRGGVTVRIAGKRRHIPTGECVLRRVERWAAADTPEQALWRAMLLHCIVDAFMIIKAVPSGDCSTARRWLFSQACRDVLMLLGMDVDRFTALIRTNADWLDDDGAPA